MHMNMMCAHTHDTYAYTCASALRQADNWEHNWRTDVRAPNGERWRFPGGSRAMIGKHACHDPRKVRTLLSTQAIEKVELCHMLGPTLTYVLANSVTCLLRTWSSRSSRRRSSGPTRPTCRARPSHP